VQTVEQRDTAPSARLKGAINAMDTAASLNRFMFSKKKKMNEDHSVKT